MIDDRRIELERADARRETINDVLKEIASLSGNEIYRRAWKKASIRVGQMVTAIETVNTTP